jgi:putative endonuclease
MWYVYAIYNPVQERVYIGQTTDLARRLKEHNRKADKSSFTSRFDGDWQLVYKESVSSRTEALKREKYLKSYRGRLFVKSFIPR